MTPADRSLLERYHKALSAIVARCDIVQASGKFFENNTIPDDGPVLDAMRKIYVAHAERVCGRSSPAEADEKAAKVFAA